MPLDSPERRLVESIITHARIKAGPIRSGLAGASRQGLTLTRVVREVLQPSGRANRRHERGAVVLINDVAVIQKMDRSFHRMNSSQVPTRLRTTKSRRGSNAGRLNR